jgi:hypothetical protein
MSGAVSSQSHPSLERRTSFFDQQHSQRQSGAMAGYPVIKSSVSRRSSISQVSTEVNASEHDSQMQSAQQLIEDMGFEDIKPVSVLIAFYFCVLL